VDFKEQFFFDDYVALRNVRGHGQVGDVDVQQRRLRRTFGAPAQLDQPSEALPQQVQVQPQPLEESGVRSTGQHDGGAQAAAFQVRHDELHPHKYMNLLKKYTRMFFRTILRGRDRFRNLINRGNSNNAVTTTTTEEPE
jgi:hypothetical protein